MINHDKVGWDRMEDLHFHVVVLLLLLVEPYGITTESSRRSPRYENEIKIILEGEFLVNNCIKVWIWTAPYFIFQWFRAISKLRWFLCWTLGLNFPEEIWDQKPSNENVVNLSYTHLIHSSSIHGVPRKGVSMHQTVNSLGRFLKNIFRWILSFQEQLFFYFEIKAHLESKKRFKAYFIIMMVTSLGDDFSRKLLKIYSAFSWNSSRFCTSFNFWVSLQNLRLSQENSLRR